MGNAQNRQSKFTEDVDAMLFREQLGAKPVAASPHDDDLEFAGKVLEARATPSPTFQSALKQRLVAKLAATETAEESRKATSPSGWFAGVFSQRTWQVAGTLAVIVVAALVVWQTGLFGRGPVVTSPYPTVAVEVMATLTSDSYAVGESVGIEFSFRNNSSKTLSFAFPPAFSIETLDAQTRRAFPAGGTTKSLAPGGSASCSVAWDQKDAGGFQVPAADYQIVMPNVTLGDAGFLSVTSAPTIIIIVP